MWHSNNRFFKTLADSQKVSERKMVKKSYVQKKIKENKKKLKYNKASLSDMLVRLFEITHDIPASLHCVTVAKTSRVRDRKLMRRNEKNRKIIALREREKREEDIKQKKREISNT